MKYTKEYCKQNEVIIDCKTIEEKEKVENILGYLFVNPKPFVRTFIYSKTQKWRYGLPIGGFTLIEAQQFIDDNFVLPEKWCIKSGEQKVIDYFNKYGFCPNSYSKTELENNYAHVPYTHGTTSGFIKKGYTEITFEQFKKYVLKEGNMENRKIKGYKCPFSLSDNTGNIVVNKDSLFVKVEEHYRCDNLISKYFGLPKEIVEQWEAVYEEIKFKVGDYIIYNGDKLSKDSIFFKGVWKIKKIEGYRVYVFDSSDWFNSHWLFEDCQFRLATQEEINNSQKIMLDDSQYEIIIKKTNENTPYATIDGNMFWKEFWAAAKTIATHSKASVVLGCDAKTSGNYQWKVSLETINKVLNKLK